MAKGRERGRRIEGQKLFTLIVWILIAGSGLADSGAESVAQELYNLRPITTASWRVDENYFYFRSLSENPYVAGLIESAAATNELSGIERELVVGVTCTVDRNTLEPQAYALYGRALKNVNPSEWAVRYQDEKERTAPEKGIESEYVAPKAILAAPMAIPAQYVIPAPTLPVEDLSDVFGNRVLALLTRQAERDLIWLEQQGQWNASYDFGFLFAMNPASLSYSGTYQLYQVGNCALMFTILSLFGTEDEVSGRSREELAGMALGLIRAKAQTHPVINSDSWRNYWPHFNRLRQDFVLGLAAWLLWDQVDESTQLLLAQIFEYDANSWAAGRAPAQLYGDSQAESNAWSGGGMALICCMLQNHPSRAVWSEKAKELMISAYATAADVADTRLVDGKPLNEWLTGPNAFPDYTVENHGRIHGDYLAAISEKARSAIAYKLAGEPVPEAVLFNNAEVFDRLMFLGLPDGTHLYMQGSDYIARRYDSFFQACNLIPLSSSPLRCAAFPRAIESIEKLQLKVPEVGMMGWLGYVFQFGIHWGTTENYLVRRFFGPGTDPLPDDQVDANLTGVLVNEPAMFAVHRTPTTLSSLSWRNTQVIGMTLGLDRDVLVSSMPNTGMRGTITESGSSSTAISVLEHQIAARADGLGATLKLERCLGGVLQYSALASLPDGTSVYLEQRVATRAITLSSATSGNVAIFDDVRGAHQEQDRTYLSDNGAVTPAAGVLRPANWINVENRLGLVALGTPGFTLKLSDQYAYSPYGTQYREGLIAFVTSESSTWAAGETISDFALISSPHQISADTETLAASVIGSGWQENDELALALEIGDRLVYANWSDEVRQFTCQNLTVEAQPGECGWLDIQDVLLPDASFVSVPEGGTSTFRLKLSARPDSNVTVNVAWAAGDADISVQSGSSLDFTTANWNTYQTVTLAASEDADALEGSAEILCSADGYADGSITATETENDIVPPVDSDGDGLPDELEDRLGRSTNTAEQASLLPFTERFETDTVGLGELNGQNLWGAVPAGTAMVQTNDFFEGVRALQIEGLGDVATAVSQVFTGTPQTVWLDMRMSVAGRITPGSIPYATAVFFFDSWGRLVVCDGARPAGQEWVTLTSHAPRSYGVWVRLTARLDYALQTWSLYLDEELVAENLGFAAPQTQPFYLTLEGQTGGFDALYVGTVCPIAEPSVPTVVIIR